MHRHGYRGKKFGRKTGQRRALMKGLADVLVINESVETTLPKAKSIVSYTEKLITQAKIGNLHNRRQVISRLSSIEAANKLFDELAPKLQNRNSGYLRVKKTSLRRGDNAQLAKVSFVDDLSKKVPVAKNQSKPQPKSASKPTVKKPSSKVVKR